MGFGRGWGCGLGFGFFGGIKIWIFGGGVEWS
jgi:hypothetical protein